MSVVIQVDRLSKQYRLGVIGGKRFVDDLNRWWAKLRGQEDPLSKVGPSPISHLPSPNSQHIWALRDVSFEVKQGEVLGIIGRNGAGKSTLLKILSRVTAPTAGEVRVKGRIASLLEVGTGFHPELTGRENIFLNGAILGMTKAEIRAKFDEIVAFSEVEKFIDTPVKRYSSGMTVRLAFAVAAHLQPEILVVDEVLAVGDAAFQKRCLGKMQKVANEGRTVLFVSHNMIAVQTLCQRGLLLSRGAISLDSTCAGVISRYFASLQHGGNRIEWASPETAPGNDTCKIQRVAVAAVPASPDGTIGMQSPVRIETDYWVLRTARTLHITYHLFNDQGIVVLTTWSRAFSHERGCYRAAFEIPANLLNSGGYYLKLLVVENENRATFVHDKIAAFEVLDAGSRDGACLAREPGVVQPPLRWETHKTR